jgi:hypothetical protein
MSEAPIRRNPSRQARSRVPRHPDSPVSFALPSHSAVVVDSSDEEGSYDSEVELVREQRATQNHISKYPSSVLTTQNLPVLDMLEVRDSPSPEIDSLPVIRADRGGKDQSD